MDELVCFEDMYLSGRLSSLLIGIENTIELRKDMATVLGEPSEVLKSPEEPLDVPLSGVYQEFCRNKRAIIKLLLFTDGPQITNIHEVYLTLPYLTLPYLTLPYLTLTYLNLPYLILSYLILH